MKSYLLLTNAGLLLITLVVIAFILVILTEAVVMLLFKLNNFRKCLLDSVMANFGTLLLMCLLILIFNKSEFAGVSLLIKFIIIYFIISLFEGWIVKLLNTQQQWKNILAASFIMNLITMCVVYASWPYIFPPE